MADRTIKLCGIGFDETPATTQITLDGVEIYNGAVYSTSEAPTYDLADKLEEISANPFVSWTEDHTYTGAKDLTITATKGDIMYIFARSNYMPISHTDAPTDYFTSGEDGWVACYYTAPDETGGVLRDPNTEVTINGVAHTRDASVANAKYGQWWWYIPEGETLSCKLNISTGIMDPIHIGVHEVAVASYTGDGVNTTFATPSYTGDIHWSLHVYIDGAEVTGVGSMSINEEGTTVTLATPPADGTTVEIKYIEAFDSGYHSYPGFELLP